MSVATSRRGAAGLPNRLLGKSQCPRITFAYTTLAVWRYFLVAHERYFVENFLVNQILTRNPTLSAKMEKAL